MAIAATFLLPLPWAWSEAGWGIEAVGRASLSEGCFVATWMAISLPCAPLAHRACRRRRVAGEPRPPA